MGNLQLPPQIHHQNASNMLDHGISEVQRLVEASRPSGSSSRRHASEFIPGFVTFVRDSKLGIWWLVLFQTCSLPDG